MFRYDFRCDQYINEIEFLLSRAYAPSCGYELSEVMGSLLGTPLPPPANNDPSTASQVDSEVDVRALTEQLRKAELRVRKLEGLLGEAVGIPIH